MSRIEGTKSSAALIVAVVALVAALGGGAVAGVAVTSLNKKDKKQVKKIAKKQGKKQAKKQIKKQEPNLNVNSAKTADEATTADNASAVNGQTIVPINHRSSGVANTEIASLNGITIRLDCASFDESIEVETEVADGEIAAISNEADSISASGSNLYGQNNDDFGPGDTFVAGPGPGNFGSERQYTLTYVGGDGRNVTAVFVTEDEIGSDDCVVGGYAVG